MGAKLRFAPNATSMAATPILARGGSEWTRRQMDLMPSDVGRLGYTIGCPGCVWMQNKPGARRLHNNNCLDRKEKALEEDDMGDGEDRSK